MKIKVILASSSKELVQSQLPNRQESIAADTEITIVAPSGCPLSTESEKDEIFSAPQIFSEASKAEQEGYDAVTIDCTLDPGLKAAKLAEAFSAPGWSAALFPERKRNTRAK